MNDVLTIAHERQRELRDEIAQIDEFIRVAETLLQNAKMPSGGGRAPQPGLRRDRPEAAVVKAANDQAEDEPDEDLQETAVADEADAADEGDQADEAASPDSDSGVRKFPWTGVQPAARRTSTDDTGPTRRNIFRRDVSAAG